MTQFEDQYNDTLRSMELALVHVYRQDEGMLDWHAETAVNNLARYYTQEQRGKRPSPPRQQPPAQQAYDDLKIVCEGWLGRNPVFDEAGQMAEIGDNALSHDELIACLKRIRRSIQMWQKEGGRRGYYEFINQFLPE